MALFARGMRGCQNSGPIEGQCSTISTPTISSFFEVGSFLLIRFDLWVPSAAPGDYYNPEAARTASRLFPDDSESSEEESASERYEPRPQFLSR